MELWIRLMRKKVLVLSFLGVLTFIAVVVGATYAYFQAQGGGSGNTNIKIGLMYASDYAQLSKNIIQN